MNKVKSHLHTAIAGRKVLPQMRYFLYWSNQFIIESFKLNMKSENTFCGSKNSASTPQNCSTTYFWAFVSFILHIYRSLHWDFLWRLHPQEVAVEAQRGSAVSDLFQHSVSVLLRHAFLLWLWKHQNGGHNHAIFYKVGLPCIRSSRVLCVKRMGT